MAGRKKTSRHEIQEHFERQASGDVIEIDENGRIVTRDAPREESNKSVVLHDPHGEYGELR